MATVDHSGIVSFPATRVITLDTLLQEVTGPKGAKSVNFQGRTAIDMYFKCNSGDSDADNAALGTHYRTIKSGSDFTASLRGDGQPRSVTYYLSCASAVVVEITYDEEGE